MDALEKYVHRRSSQWTLVLTIIATLIAIIVETSVISRVWISPVPRPFGFEFYVIPVTTALPLILCLSMQFGVRKALKAGNITLKVGNTIQIVAGILILVTYQALGDMIRLIP